jgi:glycosyltransferase involved in cell wall biosynthesis
MDDVRTQSNVAAVSTEGRRPRVSIGMPVDNASTDETRAICQEYAGIDKRIRYVRQPENLGPSVNFQFVLTEARGKYFMWAAHDDRWASSYLERTVAVLENDEGCGLAFSNYILKDLETGKEQLHTVSSSNSKSAIRNYITRVVDMCPSLIYGLYRTDSIKNTKLGNFDFADVHFVAELALGTRIQVIDDYLYIAGTKGSRKPYSMTQKKINRTIFLRNQYALLGKRFCFPVKQCLFLLVCLTMAYNKARLWRY